MASPLHNFDEVALVCVLGVPGVLGGEATLQVEAFIGFRGHDAHWQATPVE